MILTHVSKPLAMSEKWYCTKKVKVVPIAHNGCMEKWLLESQLVPAMM